MDEKAHFFFDRTKPQMTYKNLGKRNLFTRENSSRYEMQNEKVKIRESARTHQTFYSCIHLIIKFFYMLIQSLKSVGCIYFIILKNIAVNSVAAFIK